MEEEIGAEEGRNEGRGWDYRVKGAHCTDGADTDSDSVRKRESRFVFFLVSKWIYIPFVSQEKMNFLFFFSARVDVQEDSAL